MKRFIQLLLLVTTVAVAIAASAQANSRSQRDASVEVAELRTEYQVNPLGMDVLRPRFAWQLHSSQRGVSQQAYQLQVARSEEDLRRGTELVWETAKVESSASIQIGYAGKPLESRQRYYWRVRVWNEKGLVTRWSAVAWFEMGLLSPEEWQAKWIAPVADSQQPPMLRREFGLRGGVKRARVYATSHGLYRLFVNGKRAGDLELTPGFTSYHNRLQYQTYDVTQLLRNGENIIGALLGDGWYRNFRIAYGDRLGLLVQLEVTYLDGTTDFVVSDGAWTSGTGPILMSGIYDGETYDARLEREGWSRPGFDARGWAPVEVTSRPKAMLVAQSGPPVRRIEHITPRQILRTEGGRAIVDMGQNMVGWVRLSVQGPAATTVVLRHAEVLDRQGNLYTENLGGAQQTLRYTLKGKGLEVYEPHFTFQGFRYVEVTGYPGELTPDKIVGVVVHSDVGRTGDFESSSSALNQLQHNILWGVKGNFVDIPTDCPQRNERLGWTGDAQLISTTAAFNVDAAGFFARWLKDLALDQSPNGNVRWVAPDVVHEIDFEWMTGAPEAVRKRRQDAGGAAGWGDAATIIPWTLYQAYGDRRVLEAQYESMARWVAYERQRAGADLIWDGDFHFGDNADTGFESFLTPEGGISAYGGATNRDLIATAYFAHSADLLARTALVLGKAEEAANAAKLFADIRAAFQRRFVSAHATIAGGTQTAYVLALQFDLLPEPQRAVAARHLVEQVRRQGHLTTGILGSRWLLFALSEYGYLADAYRLLLREDYPSWLYPLKHGATTIWERWDGIRPDGSFPPPAMDSFNHYALGAVGEWMYRVIGGINIDPAAPGYRHILIQPQPGGGLTWARASHVTPYGTVSSSWRIESGAFHLHVEIPPNTTATIRFHDAVTRVGSGRYDFRYPLPQPPHEDL